jgi:hypothetical protein
MMDTNNKLSVHRVFTGIYFVLALVTLIPTPTASKLSLLGYKALCSFSPISTIGLLALAGLHFIYSIGRLSAKYLFIEKLRNRSQL